MPSNHYVINFETHKHYGPFRTMEEARMRARNMNNENPAEHHFVSVTNPNENAK